MNAQAKIEKNEIVIRVDISSLKIIVDAGPHGDLMKVTNAKKFAKELVRELNDEEEDGTTAIHRMFDDAILMAYEHGAEGVKDQDEE